MRYSKMPRVIPSNENSFPHNGAPRLVKTVQALLLKPQLGEYFLIPIHQTRSRIEGHVAQIPGNQGYTVTGLKFLRDDMAITSQKNIRSLMDNIEIDGKIWSHNLQYSNEMPQRIMDNWRTIIRKHSK